MKYRVKVIPKAEKDLDAISGHDFDTIKKKILAFLDPWGPRKW